MARILFHRDTIKLVLHLQQRLAVKILLYHCLFIQEVKFLFYV